MTATTSSLAALRAAARAGDRVAMLLLADVAEDGGDDARAGAWRFLADPPRERWERGAWGTLLLPLRPGEYNRDVGRAVSVRRAWHEAISVRLYAPGEDPPEPWVWWQQRDGDGWRAPGSRGRLKEHATPPAAVRGAVLAACVAALAVEEALSS